MQTKSTRGVQLEDVCNAAEALIAEGLPPTIERVRLKIGRGSPNTVGPMLKTWFASLAPRLGVAAPGASDAVGVPAAVRLAMDSVWSAALDSARHDVSAALDEERRVLASQRAELLQDRASHERQLAAREQQEAAQSEALGLAKSQLADKVERIQRLEAEHLRGNQELAQSRATLASLMEARHADRRQFDAQIADEMAARRQAEDRNAATEKRHLEEIDRARQDTKTARAALLQAQRQQQDTQQRLEALTNQHNDAQVALASARERLAAAGEREIELRRQVEQYQSAAAAALAQVAQGKPSRSSGVRKMAPRPGPGVRVRR